MLRCLARVALVLFVASFPCFQFAQEAPAAKPTPTEGDYTAHDFHFKTGETLPELACTTSRSASR